MKRIYLATLVLGLVALATQAEAGTDRRIGTAGAQELRIPVGTRGIALAGATVASNHGLESVFYNPAGLASTEGVEAYFGNTSYIADINVRYLALSSKMDWGSLAFTAKVLDLGDLIVTTEDAPEGTGQVETLTFAVIGLTASRYLTDAISFGATGYFINESILDVHAKGVAFDMGLHYDLPWRNARFGLVMKNLGPDMAFDGANLEHSVQIPGSSPNSRPRVLRTQSAAFDLPTYFELGGEMSAWTSGDNQVMGYGTYQSNNFSKDEFRGGVEYNYQDLLSLRGGYAYADQNDYLFGPSFGAGLNLPLGGGTVSVDYAFQSVDSFFDDMHTISARFKF
ncbi:MAG: PorV/PorQ family protein [Candidatus Eisenbacteria bacterium]|uniref:PorV/PorQ family protein n=1 Tax=Eiseniibacteriota bacterium TaxID=2212470 RepID=A0A956M0B4_UNCEI|nr:PorV/PorQ family protein [Candidatus Eisenbacteria bacterium]